MGSDFNWHFDEEPGQDPHDPRGHGQRIRGLGWFWTITAVIALLFAGGWFLRARLMQAENGLQAQAQAILDGERAALLAGDGERFFALQAVDPAWQAQQLQPDLVAQQRSGLTLTQVEAQESHVWANAVWDAGGETLQRVLFFYREPGDRLLHVPSDSLYWGEELALGQPWGTLRLHAADEQWATSIADNVAAFLEAACARQPCRTDRPQLVLAIADRYETTAVDQQITLPSPRLVGLDGNGRPSDRFWQMLSTAVTAQMTPVTLRTAVPPARQQHVNYAAAAAAFTAEHPHISIELVEVDALPTDPDALAQFDAVAFAPTADLIAAGLVRDLTPFAATDPAFRSGDFYEQIWQGALWRERFWFVPQGARMPLVFFDPGRYRAAGLSEPSLRWTWEEMQVDAAALMQADTADPGRAVALLDTSASLLYAYAYSWHNDCAPPATALCSRPLAPANITAALTWYATLVEQGLHPDLTRLAPEERALALDRFQSVPRRAAIWVDEPVRYEHQLQIDALGIVPFPGSDRFDGVTPLWVEGTFMTQATSRPSQTWEWLTYLSYQTPLREFRLVPARPSVAERSGYWFTLPRPLAEAQRTAFPFARPVTIADLDAFAWSRVTAVVQGTRSVEEAAGPARLNWFGYDAAR